MKLLNYKKMKRGLVVALLIAGSGVSFAQDKISKSWSNHYKVGNGDRLSINNKFGQVNAHIWDKNEVDVKVEITVENAKEDKAQRILDMISIADNQSGNHVEVTTEFKGEINNNNGKLQIDYTINMPAHLHYDLELKFGKGYLQNLDGACDMLLKYSHMKVGKLTNLKNHLEVKFGSLSAEYIETANIELKYSELKAEMIKSLNLESAYSKVKITEVGKLTHESAFDEVKFESLGDVNLEIKYGGFKTNEIRGSLNVEAAYTNVSVGRYTASEGKVNLETKYGNIAISVPSGKEFSFAGEVRYGSVHIPNSIKQTMHIEKDHTSTVYDNQGNTKGLHFSFSGQYGNLKLNYE